ncbi:50S ribosomal protein L19 [Candidatus Kaiserbacteria bacterium RIFCSPLOWO2_01_FULL_53_17]|uniref:50S ribosomal protein L19 n=1 Tax=Candidatus Kaiserbacteria bacterium RIFCSPLOWO2_01_FULL_53_17 TaxID=1798511 RepID=A0A1F6EGP5_9BACT|nr:MAG: 50S ribosomal protein L19 [Candidatus Kaiserbacteria bacterium RIFCSPLOWO2_01_FULL_53_17]
MAAAKAKTGSKISDLKSGDTVRVWQKIEEKGKVRLQAFEGLVLARKHGNEAGGTFTVRKVSGGVGVEKIFPVHSPMIDRVELVKRARVRRAKLYFIREKVAREARRQLRRARLVPPSGEADVNVETHAEPEAALVETGTPEENK